MTALRMLSPDYASPEQATGGRVSTATDIYSLGAVLYRLTTGKPAHEFPDHSPETIAHVITEREVTAPGSWAPELKGDLEFILLKALRKDPQDRYGTVEQFADDLEAFLDSRPVRARSGNAWYRMRKFLRRYRAPVMATTLVMTSLSIGLYVANRERAAANRERLIAQRRFNDVRQLANKLFDIDRQVLGLPGGAKTRQLIVDTSLEYLGRLAADARSDPDLALDLGTAYLRVGRVLGVPISANLGQTDNAEKQLRTAGQLIASVLRVQPANRVAFLRAAQIAHDRMVLAEDRHPDTEALPLARQSEAWLEKYLSTGKIDDAEKQQVVIAAMNIGYWYGRKDLIDESLHLTRRAIEIAIATGQPWQAGAAQINVARVLRSVGDLDGALAAIRDGVRLLDPPQPGGETTFSFAIQMQGDVLGDERGISMGRFPEAATYFERAYQIAVKWARQDVTNANSQFRLANGGFRLAGVLRHSDPRRALEIHDEVLGRLAGIKNNSVARSNEARALAASTYPLRQLGRSAEARRRLDDAFSRLREIKLYPAEKIEPGSVLSQALCALAEFEAAAGNVRRGIEIYQELIVKTLAASKPEDRLEDATDLSNLYHAQAQLHRRARQPEAAGALDARRVELWRQWDQKLPDNPFIKRQLAR